MRSVLVSSQEVLTLARYCGVIFPCGTREYAGWAVSASQAAIFKSRLRVPIKGIMQFRPNHCAGETYLIDRAHYRSLIFEI